MSTRRFQFRTTFLLTLTLGSALSSFPWAASAQRYIPPDLGLPGRREGGGTRGDCVRPTQNDGDRPSTLTALMPDKNLGLTTSTTPTLFWYVPENAATAAEFILMDEGENEIYKARFRVTGEAGIISLNLPEEAGLPPLEVGKNYHWSFALLCANETSTAAESTVNNAMDNYGIVFTEGWIQRIEADAELQERLGNTPEQDRSSVYAEAGIWQDAIASLASQRRSQPTNPLFSTRWNTLLDSVGLSNVSGQPLMQRYQLAATAPASPTDPAANSSSPVENSSDSSSESQPLPSQNEQ